MATEFPLQQKHLLNKQIRKTGHKLKPASSRREGRKLAWGMLEDHIRPWAVPALFGDNHLILRGLQVIQKSTPPPNILTQSTPLPCSKQLYELEKSFSICVTAIIVLPWFTVLVQTSWLLWTSIYVAEQKHGNCSCSWTLPAAGVRWTLCGHLVSFKHRLFLPGTGERTRLHSNTEVAQIHRLYRCKGIP